MVKKKYSKKSAPRSHKSVKTFAAVDYNSFILILAGALVIILLIYFLTFFK
ncbi:MAG TPA: hypothetical protein VMR41_04605 [Patescibacteria group bacterium]|nr:hypothetical protein [Patescibacteria group bacterium]